MDDNVFVQEDGRDEDEDPGQAVDDVEDILLDHVGGQEGKKEAWGWCLICEICERGWKEPRPRTLERMRVFLSAARRRSEDSTFLKDYLSLFAISYDRVFLRLDQCLTWTLQICMQRWWRERQPSGWKASRKPPELWRSNWRGVRWWGNRHCRPDALRCRLRLLRAKSRWEDWGRGEKATWVRQWERSKRTGLSFGCSSQNGTDNTLQFLRKHFPYKNMWREGTCGGPEKHPQKVGESPKELASPCWDDISLRCEEQPCQLKQVSIK